MEKLLENNSRKTKDEKMENKNSKYKTNRNNTNRNEEWFFRKVNNKRKKTLIESKNSWVISIEVEPFMNCWICSFPIFDLNGEIDATLDDIPKCSVVRTKIHFENNWRQKLKIIKRKTNLITINIQNKTKHKSTIQMSN
jgi:hypothetical protein